MCSVTLSYSHGCCNSHDITDNTDLVQLDSVIAAYTAGTGSMSSGGIVIANNSRLCLQQLSSFWLAQNGSYIEYMTSQV